MADRFIPGKVYKFNPVRSIRHFENNPKKRVTDIYFGHERPGTKSVSIGKFMVKKSLIYVSIQDEKGFPWTIFPGECDEY